MKILQAKLLDWTEERKFLHFSMAVLASPCSASITIFLDFCLILLVRVFCSTAGLSSSRSTTILSLTSSSSSFLPGLSESGALEVRDSTKDSIMGGIITLLTPLPVIDDRFCAWKQPLCYKDTAKGKKFPKYGAFCSLCCVFMVETNQSAVNRLILTNERSPLCLRQLRPAWRR